MRNKNKLKLSNQSFLKKIVIFILRLVENYLCDFSTTNITEHKCSRSQTTLAEMVSGLKGLAANPAINRFAGIGPEVNMTIT